MSVQVLDGATILSFVEDDEAFTGSIQERFVLLDTDHNGVLSYGEMLKELQSLRVLETHFGIDVKTDPDELTHVYDNLFLLFDHDSNGTVDMDEFKAEMKQMMLAMADGLGFLPVQMALEENSLLMKAVQRESTSLFNGSMNISKLRTQNRLEATTRRERALAYSFSQQLRVCPKKKHSRTQSEVTESNMGWSWLERWMATRQQEKCLLDITKQYEPPNSNKISAVRKRLLFDVTGEDESCGSNQVSVQVNNLSASGRYIKADKSFKMQDFAKLPLYREER